MNEYCRKCKHAKDLNYNEKWKVETWFCETFHELIADYVLIINCPGYDPYDENLHDNSTAQTGS